MAVGLFITIEGPEGSGKTTQAKLLYEYLINEGYDVLWTLEPGGTQTGKQVREILLHGNSQIDPFTELFLFESARSQHVRELLIPALEQGRIILSDRYIDSTLAYQGYGRGLNRTLIRVLDLLSTAGLEPDATLLLDINPELGMARRLGKGKVEVAIGEDGRAVLPESPSTEMASVPAEADRIEREKADFHRRVREGFLDLASLAPERFITISAEHSVEEIQAAIRLKIDQILSSAAETETRRASHLERIKQNLRDGTLLNSLQSLLEKENAPT